MQINLSYISHSRMERIIQADNADAAADMWLIDRLIDTIFRAGAKEANIRALFVALQNAHAVNTPLSISDQLAHLQDLRNLIRPEHRDYLTLELNQESDDSCGYDLHFMGHLILSRKGIQDRFQIAELHRARNFMKVEDFFDELLTHAPSAPGLVLHNDGSLIEQAPRVDCHALGLMMGIDSRPAMQKSLRRMVEITQNNELRLKFHTYSTPDSSYKFSDYEKLLATENRFVTAGDFIAIHDDELALMRKKGYTLRRKHDQLLIDISQEKLKEIAGEMISPNQYSLIVNVANHITRDIVSQGYSIAHRKFNINPPINDNTIAGLPHFGPQSTLANKLEYNDRRMDYALTTASLLKFLVYNYCRAENLEMLKTQLMQTKSENICIASGDRKGFACVNMWHPSGNSLEPHTLLLHSLELDSKNQPTGVYLQNPLGKYDNPKYLSVENLFAQHLCLYICYSHNRP